MVFFYRREGSEFRNDLIWNPHRRLTASCRTRVPQKHIIIVGCFLWRSNGKKTLLACNWFENGECCNFLLYTIYDYTLQRRKNMVENNWIPTSLPFYVCMHSGEVCYYYDVKILIPIMIFRSTFLKCALSQRLRRAIYCNHN